MNTAIVRERVQEFFGKHPREGFKSRQLQKRLSIKTDAEFQVLREILHTMVDEEELAWTNSRGYHRVSKRTGLRGTIRIYKTHGIVLLTETKKQIYVDKKFFGVALNGDTVEVGLFAAKKKKENFDFDGEGEILRVVHRATTQYVGTLQRSQNFFFVLPDDPTMSRDIYIPPQSLNGASSGDKVLVEFIEWNDEHLNPEGKVIEKLGKAGNPFVELESVIHAFKLPKHFPKEVEEYVAKISAAIPDEEFKKRMDIRFLDIVTIDPFDAKDFDDALSLEFVDDENVKLGVHIADVSAYVKEGSVLDDEAFNRGTSVYLANQVIPMLPEKLSNNLCSLNPNVDRLAFTCFMTINKKGKVNEFSFTRSVINSKRRFTYEEVEKILDDKVGDHAELLRDIWSVAKILRKNRMKDGSIDFDSPEAKFTYLDNGKPKDIVIKKRLKSHQLVEECMLLANQTVATYVAKLEIGKETPPFVYRIHDIPKAEKLKDLAIFVQKFGYKLNVSNAASSKELQQLLLKVHGSKEENVINEVALRSMAKAVYSENNIGHYGLAFHHYTHFTSPIRRYPDLLVHRMLDEYLHGMSHSRIEKHRRELPTQCKWCSERERVATEAERESIKVMQVEYMLQHIGDEFDGIISGVMQFGIFIELNDLLVEGLLHVRDIDDDYYMFDEKHYSLIGERSGRTFRLGDSIKVKVVRVNAERRKIDFGFADTDIKEAKGKRTVKKRRH